MRRADPPARAGAFCAHADVRAAGADAGPLAGLTFAVKDLFAVEGVTACCGNPTWLATHAPATRTAPTVRALLEAGATLVGLTITDEMALSLTGENHHYGTPLNPRAPARVPGGSSSGSASAVASGLADFALGTDTGGSVRVPASHCGILGFRPSHGAVSAEGVWPLAPRFDTVGWFARDAGVLARVGQVLLEDTPGAAVPGQAPGPAAPLRLLFPEEAARFVEPSAFAAFARAAGALARRLGCPLEPAAIAGGEVTLESWLDVYLVLQNAEVAGLHRAWIEEARPRFGALIAPRIARALAAARHDADQHGDGEGDSVHARAERQRAAVVARSSERIASSGGGAWLIWPSAPGAAPLRGAPDDVIDAVTGRALTLSALASLAGLPQISLPLADVDGAPLGVSLIAGRGGDRALLAAVAAIDMPPPPPEAHPEVTP